MVMILDALLVVNILGGMVLRPMMLHKFSNIYL